MLQYFLRSCWYHFDKTIPRRNFRTECFLPCSKKPTWISAYDSNQTILSSSSNIQFLIYLPRNSAFQSTCLVEVFSLKSCVHFPSLTRPINDMNIDFQLHFLTFLSCDQACGNIIACIKDTEIWKRLVGRSK